MNRLNKNARCLLLALCWTGLFSSCLKSSDSPLTHSTALAFTGKNLVQSLAADSSLRLFNQAFNRLSLSSGLDSAKGYTLFALTDSAMNAAGLTSTVISSLPIDSLRKLISYQIVLGIFDDASLTNCISAIQVTTLRQDTLIRPGSSPYVLSQAVPTPLFIKEVDKAFYLNGVPVARTRSSIQTSNGYIYPIGAFITPIPTRLLYDIIQSDPDLSLYNQALIIGDSIRMAALGYTDSPSLDVYVFSHPTTDAYSMGFLPTLLAPTNKAFNAAGFYTADDIRKYAASSFNGFDANYYFHCSSLDSVLKHHMLYNNHLAGATPLITTIRLFYNDLLNPAINNGVFNNYTGPGLNAALSGALQIPVPLNFSNADGTVYVKWNNDPAAQAAPLPLDASPQQSKYNFITSNGQLYKIDKLFYPAVH